VKPKETGKDTMEGSQRALVSNLIQARDRTQSVFMFEKENSIQVWRVREKRADTNPAEEVLSTTPRTRPEAAGMTKPRTILRSPSWMPEQMDHSRERAMSKILTFQTK
jgi:hypothetical protein